MAADYKQVTIEDFKKGLYIQGLSVRNDKLAVLTAEGFNMLISDEGIKNLGHIFREGKCSFFPDNNGVNSCLLMKSDGFSLTFVENGIPTLLVDIALLRGKSEIAKILVEVYGANPTKDYNKFISNQAVLASQEYIATQRAQLVDIFTSTPKDESKPISAYTFFGKISDAMGEQQEFEQSLNRTQSLDEAKKLVDMVLEGKVLSREFKSKVEAVDAKIAKLEQFQNGKGTVFNEEFKSKIEVVNKKIADSDSDSESLQHGKSAYSQRIMGPVS